MGSISRPVKLQHCLPHMGEMTLIQIILGIGMLLVNGPVISDGWMESENATSKGLVKEEVRVLCEKLEEDEYDQNRTLWKLKMIPVEDIFSHKKVTKYKSVGLFSTSLDITYGQLEDLMTEQWIENKFDKLLQKRLENRETKMPGQAFKVNALVVVDKTLNRLVANSSQFVKEFLPLVNHLLGSVRIEIKIIDILLESSQINYGFIEPLDEEHGLKTLQPSSAFLWEVQKRKPDYDVVLLMSGLNICERTGSSDPPFSCNVAGSARQYVSDWPFYRKHSCAHKHAIIEVLNPHDTVSKWLTAAVAAHEIVHLIGSTQHDGEDDYYGGGPGGGDCREEDGHIMAPSLAVGSLYRLCKDFDPWSQCTIQQVKFYTSDWTQFCPGSFFTRHERPLYYGLLILPIAAIAVLLYFLKKKQLAKNNKAEDVTDESRTQATAVWCVVCGVPLADADIDKDTDTDTDADVAEQEHNAEPQQVIGAYCKNYFDHPEIFNWQSISIVFKQLISELDP